MPLLSPPRHVLPISILLVLLPLLLALSLPSGATALAHSREQSPTPICSSQACTGLDPYKSGCADTISTLAAQDEGQLRIELEYSPRCQSAWAQAYWLDQVSRPLGASVTRDSGADGQAKIFTHWSNGDHGTWWINTDQFWSPHTSLHVCAYTQPFIQSGPLPDICTSASPDHSNVRLQR